MNKLCQMACTVGVPHWSARHALFLDFIYKADQEKVGDLGGNFEDDMLKTRLFLAMGCVQRGHMSGVPPLPTCP